MSNLTEEPSDLSKSQTTRSFPKINLITILLIILSFTLGWNFGHGDYKAAWKDNRFNLSVDNRQPPKDVNLDFTLFWQTWDLVSKEYVDKKAVDPQKMYYGAIQGMVSALGDPYTVFLPPESQKATQEELGGSFEGVGIQLGFNKEKRLVVIAPLKGTPADTAGVKPGDLILKINDKDTNGISLPDAVNLIRGPKGSEVVLEMFTEGEKEPKNISLKRDTIVVKSVEFETKNSPKGKKIAYIKLTRFGDKTNSEWEQAVSETLASGANGVVLDMRNNPGGYLDGAVYIASEFLKDGNVVLQENSAGERQGYKVNRKGKLLNIPLVVLINKGSASASEIVAGSIQDTKRGKLIGETSFGKGTIQSSHELPSGTGVHVTTAKWLTPNGNWIHNIGLTPDIEVKPDLEDESKDLQLDKALESLD